MTAALPDALVALNVDGEDALPRAHLTGALERFGHLAVPARIAAWATYFLDRGQATYRPGDAPGGYISQGLLVDDRHTDCVLFTTRAVELAHAASPEDALGEAIARRFPGAPPEDVIDTDGRVGYAHPAHIAYAYELLEAGVLGRNVTRSVGPVVADTATSHFEPGRVEFVPGERVRLDALRDGDVVFLILDESHPGARRVRERIGAAVGHMGVVRVSGSEPELVHAASSDLPGAYTGGRIAAVPLGVYLARVERFKGIAVARTDLERATPARRAP